MSFTFTRFMAASGGQRSPFGFEEAFKGEDAFKEGLGGIQEELMCTTRQTYYALYNLDTRIDELISFPHVFFLYCFKPRKTVANRIDAYSKQLSPMP